MPSRRVSVWLRMVVKEGIWMEDMGLERRFRTS